MAKAVYDIIKKQNGEGFARVLRDKGLLDIPDIANIVKYAGHSKEDAEKIFPYLWSLKEFKEETDTITNTDPFQLLDQAGYHAFEVHNLNQQNSIWRFFRKDEELCTFRDDMRYKNYHIIHAIKHNVWRDPYAIKPSPNPQRQDEYGTSVISIQIAKNGGFISIKNRYNHSVNHPDQTFNSNPDEIIAGLSAALKVYFNIDWKSTGKLPAGFINIRDQVLKTEFELNNHYFGDGFYTDNNNIIDIDKRHQVQMDYFVWDNQQKKLLNPSDKADSFVDVFNKFVQGKQVTISGKSPNQTFIVDGVEAIKLENNQIASLNLPGVTEIGDNFLEENKLMREISLPSAIKIGNDFLYENESLEKILLPRAESIGLEFLYNNKKLTEISLPQAKHIGFYFLHFNKKIKNVFMPLVEQISELFLDSNNQANLYMPNLNHVTISERFRRVKPAINVPITDVFPDRRSIAQCFKYAIRKIHNYVRTAYHTIPDHEI